MTISGIYEIVDHKKRSYIGSSNDVHKRWEGHKRSLRAGKHHSLKLQRAWNKYGEACFHFRILQFVPDESELIACEQYFMDLCSPFYNMAKVAGRPEWSDDRKDIRRAATINNEACRTIEHHEIGARLERMHAVIQTVLRMSSLAYPEMVSPKATIKHFDAYKRASRGLDPWNIMDRNFYETGWCWNEMDTKFDRRLMELCLFVFHKAKFPRLRDDGGFLRIIPPGIHWDKFYTPFNQKAVARRLKNENGNLTAPVATFILNSIANGSSLRICLDAMHFPVLTQRRWVSLLEAGREKYAAFEDMLDEAEKRRKEHLTPGRLMGILTNDPPGFRAPRQV